MTELLLICAAVAAAVFRGVRSDARGLAPSVVSQELFSLPPLRKRGLTDDLHLGV